MIRKFIIGFVALAVAIAFSPLADLQAATFVKPFTEASADNLTHAVKMKRKRKAQKKKKRRKGKRAKRKASGSCGTYMYRKGGKCMDARLKK
jgi:hypothetical protein